MRSYYTPPLFELLVKTIPRLNPTKNDVLHFFREAGVEPRFLHGFWETESARTLSTKTEITRAVLTSLDEARNAARGARLEIVARVADFTDYARCRNEPATTMSLVAEVRRLAKIQNSFTNKNAFDRKTFWTATPQSVKAQRVSVLALAETALAMLISVGIYIHTGSMVHIVVAAAIAPFLLVQTPLSTKRALKLAFAATQPLYSEKQASNETVAELMKGYSEDPEEWRSRNKWRLRRIQILRFVLPPALQLLALMVLWLVKPLAVLYTLIRNPLYSLSRVPENWRRLVVYTDSTVPPEPTPHFARFAVVNKWGRIREPMYRFAMFQAEAIALYAAYRGAFVIPLHPIVILFLLLPVLVVSFAYRLSIKSTALVWSPLLWVFRTIHDVNNIPHLARGLVELGAYRVARVYSALIVFLGAIKAYIWVYWQQLAETLHRLPGWKDLAHYLLPEGIAIWHLAALANALLSWWLYIRATRLLHDIAGGTNVEMDKFREFVRATFFTRNALSIYTSMCLLYTTFWIATGIAFRPLHLVFFPWQH